jgi:glycosyltransferase involved in cell wall biosynthesis
VPEKLEYLERLEVKRELEMLNNICEENNIKTIFFPHIERARKVIGLIEENRYSLNGILFYPFSRICYKNNYFIYRSLRTLKSQLQSILSTYRIFFNRNWENVFILNDEKAIFFYQRLPLIRGTFKFIPDPMSQFISREVRVNTREHYNIGSGNKLIVCLGSLSERKNVHRLVVATKSLNKKLKKNFTLLIAGTGNSQYTDLVNKLIDKDQNIVFDNRFLDEAEFNAIIQDADVVAIPYLNFFWSSGLLNHAIFHENKILASNTGLISELVRDYNLGETVNPYDVESLERGIRNLLTKEYSMEVARFYKEKRPTPKAFASTILQSLSNHR